MISADFFWGGYAQHDSTDVAANAATYPKPAAVPPGRGGSSLAGCLLGRQGLLRKVRR